MLHFKNLFIAVVYSFIFCISIILIPLNAQERNKKDSFDTIKIKEVLVKEHIKNLSNSTILNQEELNQIQSKSLGETLGHIPGIQNSYMGPNVGTPMIRSLSGNRVKILNNGLSLNDLSGISPNFNLPVDMDNLLGMEIYKRSASVLYGGKAIGGAVNLKDNTIPSLIFPKKLQGFALIEYGTNSGNRYAVNLSGNIGKYLAWHVGAMDQKNDNLKIPGNTKPPIAYDPNIDDLTQALAQVHVNSEILQDKTLYPYLNKLVLERLGDPKWGLSEADLYSFEKYSIISGKQIENPANDKYIPGQDPNLPLFRKVVYGITDYAEVQKGIIPNSHANNRAFNIGSSYIIKDLKIGVGYRANDGFYGIPGFALLKMPKHNHDHAADIPELQYDPINTRTLSHSLLFESSYSPINSILKVLRLNYSYQLSDDRELIGIYRVNKFNSARQAVRMEMELHPTKFWRVLSGMDNTKMKLEGEGIQRYLPNNMSHESGVFALNRFFVKNLSADIGYRLDRVNRRALPDSTYQTGRGMAGGNLSSRTFHLNQLTTGLQWDVLEIALLKASFSHSERAPDVNELYAGNNHFAIMIEENGDDKLKKEMLNSFEYGLGISYKGFYLTSNYYHNNFSNYIYLGHTGLVRSGGFVIKEWRSASTMVKGVEFESKYKSIWLDKNEWSISGYFDLVKNINTSTDEMREWSDGIYMPNLPTSRYGMSGMSQYEDVVFHLSFDRFLKQKYLGKNINEEPAMPAYSMLAARVDYHTSILGYKILFYLTGNNLLNVEARPQQSLVKYLAPLPGRNVSLGLRINI